MSGVIAFYGLILSPFILALTPTGEEVAQGLLNLLIIVIGLAVIVAVVWLMVQVFWTLVISIPPLWIVFLAGRELMWLRTARR